ncbi:MAG TPA: Rrf2 family transcriptional regulator [Thermoanaerobaculia bacterium]|nr:Rrf2 family transcriptional regulator [Thermoanaerobaculia bacterium]
MFFTRAQEIAFAALPLLDPRGPQGKGRGVDSIAQAAGVPAPFLSKVLGRLVDRGLLRSKRGRGGGFVLGRPASEITLGDVALALERRDDLERAFPSVAGPVGAVLSSTRRDFLDRLQRTRLSDLAAAEKTPPNP